MSWPNEPYRHTMSRRGIRTHQEMIQKHQEEQLARIREERAQERYWTRGCPLEDNVFTTRNLILYTIEDEHWTDELAPLVKKYDAKAALYEGVAVYVNYIPLYRPGNFENSFKMAEPKTVYIWNINDFPTTKFYRIVDKIAKQTPQTFKLDTTSDVGGF